MKISMRWKMLLVSTLILAGWAGQPCAQDYPNRPVRLISPFSAGGGNDILARILGARMSESMGQPFLIDNRPGGNSLIGTEILVRSEPNGYTLILQTNNLTVNPTLYEGKISFDTVRDLAPISLIGGTPHVIVVHPSVPARNLSEFVALAKSRLGSITFGTAGTASATHLAGELLKKLADINLLAVPYKGSGQVMPDLLSGQLHSLFATMPSVMPHIQAGRLRALAVTTLKRFRGLPDVPTVAESGYPGYDFSSWFGMLAPAGTPQPIIERLNAEIIKALKNPQRLEDFEILGSTPKEFAAFIQADMETTGKLLRASGATAY